MASCRRPPTTSRTWRARPATRPSKDMEKRGTKIEELDTPTQIPLPSDLLPIIMITIALVLLFSTLSMPMQVPMFTVRKDPGQSQHKEVWTVTSIRQQMGSLPESAAWRPMFP